MFERLSTVCSALAAAAAFLALAACDTVGGGRPAGPGATGPLALPDAPSKYDRKQFIEPPHLLGREPVRVGLLLPFSAQSEDVRAVASSLFDAAQLAAFDAGDAGFLIIPKDTKGEPEAAAAAARSALAEGAELLIGPLFSASVAAVAQVAQAAETPVIAFSSDLAVAGNGVYLLSHPPEIEIARVTDYAVLNGYGRFGLMAPMTDYGERVSESFTQEVFARGGVLVHEERYIQDPQQMLQPAKRFAKYSKEVIPVDRRDGYQPGGQEGGVGNETAELGYVQGYQAVMIAEQGTLLRALAPLLPYYDVDISKIKLLGVSQWDDAELTREPALSGGWFAAPDPEFSDAFAERFRQTYGSQPARLASLAYDATFLAARLAQEPRRRRFTAAAIADEAGFIGADGLFRFRPDGKIERGLAIMELRSGGVQVIDPAPRSFDYVVYDQY